jgi:hypothetical protein
MPHVANGFLLNPCPAIACELPHILFAASCCERLPIAPPTLLARGDVVIE